MADETPEDRIEAALDRIAKAVDAREASAAGPMSDKPMPDKVTGAVEDRLDRMIDTLREALGK